MRQLSVFLLLGLLGMQLLPAQPEERRRQRGPDKAPKVGDAIPKVSAKTPDGKKTVDLNKPKRHTVLVFGSYT